MSRESPAEITRLLRAWGNGDQAALDELTPMVYGELRRMAAQVMDRENPGNSLQPTALVHEAYLRLVHVGDVGWQDRTHFFAVSARMMRRIMVDSARARATGKRGGGTIRIKLDESLDTIGERAPELVALDDALEALARFDVRKARVVEMRFFGGLSVEETAVVLRISDESVKRDWKLARAWLMREMGARSSASV
jgi:RNA polymerase sigma-70 factor, ECF subfamily